jgi:hypothetical protein
VPRGHVHARQRLLIYFSMLLFAFGIADLRASIECRRAAGTSSIRRLSLGACERLGCCFLRSPLLSSLAGKLVALASVACKEHSAAERGQTEPHLRHRRRIRWAFLHPSRTPKRVLPKVKFILLSQLPRLNSCPAPPFPPAEFNKSRQGKCTQAQGSNCLKRPGDGCDGLRLRRDQQSHGNILKSPTPPHEPP